MRHTSMNRLVAVAALFAAFSVPALAQTSEPPNTTSPFHDTSMIKPPAGAKVALWEFEDLECPACAHAFPIVHAALAKYHIPFIRHDFPLPMHVWSFDAAVTARYLQDKVSPQVAEQFRGDVFASQTGIASKDDLENYTRRWFQNHHLNMPFVMDPTGAFTAEVKKDRALGERIGLNETPTIIVATPTHWIQVTDVNYLYSTIDTALAETSRPATTRTSAHRRR